MHLLRQPSGGIFRWLRRSCGTGSTACFGLAQAPICRNGRRPRSGVVGELSRALDKCSVLFESRSALLTVAKPAGLRKNAKARHLGKLVSWISFPFPWNVYCCAVNSGQLPLAIAYSRRFAPDRGKSKLTCAGSRRMPALFLRARHDPAMEC
jgi:hypothetical protein